MDISEYTPPKSLPTPPTSLRKDRTKLTTVLLLVGTFFGTLGVLSRHEIAESLSRHFAKAAKREAPQNIAHAATSNVPGPAAAPTKQLPSADQAYATGKADNRQAEASPFR